MQKQNNMIVFNISIHVILRQHMNDNAIATLAREIVYLRDKIEELSTSVPTRTVCNHEYANKLEQIGSILILCKYCPKCWDYQSNTIWDSS